MDGELVDRIMASRDLVLVTNYEGRSEQAPPSSNPLQRVPRAPSTDCRAQACHTRSVASKASDSNVLLTGIPRSGTTLACELLNRLPDTVALDEPMGGRELDRLSRPATDVPPDSASPCDEISGFLEEMRELITTRKVAVSKHVEGRISGGKLGDEMVGSLRTDRERRGEVRVEKPLSRNFLLVIKHPGVFTALLETLVRRFQVYAIVRNPLAILASWQTIPFTMRDGRHPIAERIDRGLAGSLDEAHDRIDRQLTLLSWYFEKYGALPEDRVIRYESIVSSKGRALEAITERASTLNEDLESRNTAEIYERTTMLQLAERLLDSNGPVWHFYTRQSVEELVA
jgi:hypothetical protein